MAQDDRSRDELLDEVRRLERRLREQTRIAAYLSEKQSQFLAEVMPQQMWTATPDGRLDYVNQAAVQYFGRPAAELVGEGWLAGVHPDDMPEVVARWVRALETGEPYEVKFRLRRHDGQYRWHLGRAQAFLPDGEIRRWYGHNTDVAEQMDQNAALAASESRHRLIGEAVHDGLWFWEIEADALEWNDRLLEMLGVTRDAWGGRFEDWLSRVHPDDRPQLLARLDAHLARQEPYHVPAFRLRQADGSWRYYSTRGQAEFDADGRPIRMAGGVTDIDRAKRTEDALRFLADASRELHASLDLERTLENIARAAVPAIADWCAVDLLQASGQLRRVATAHVDPAKVALALDVRRRFPPAPDSPTGPEAVVRTGRPEIWPVITDDMIRSLPDADYAAAILELGLRSSMCVALRDGDRAVGAITLVSAESGRRFGPVDLEIAEDLAHRASTALHSARLYTEIASLKGDTVP